MAPREGTFELGRSDNNVSFPLQLKIERQTEGPEGNGV